MEALPDLFLLSVAEKDALIVDLWLLVRKLTAQVTTLESKVLELEARLAQNSRNSSKPPSSDGLSKPKPQSLRKAGEHPNGGQTGPPGHALEKVPTPDRTELHRPPSHCDACGGFLNVPTVVETRQVFDLPKRGQQAFDDLAILPLFPGNADPRRRETELSPKFSLPRVT